MKPAFIALLMGLPLFLLAQEGPTPLRSLSRLDGFLQGLHYTYELRSGGKTTIDFSAGIGGGYNISENSFEYYLNPAQPAIAISVTPKYFYNQSKRAAKGKNTALNSGNYIGARFMYVTRNIAGPHNFNDATLLNIHWGLQRTIGGKWALGAHLGVGYAVEGSDLTNGFGTVYPAASFRFSYILSKKRN